MENVSNYPSFVYVRILGNHIGPMLNKGATNLSQLNVMFNPAGCK